jgi:thiol-disulfide isomerase/thioredoxin
MKRIMRSLLPLIFLTGSAFSQIINLPKGKTFEITSSHTQTGTFNSTESFTYSFRSLGKDHQGNFILEARIVKALANNLQTQQMQLNTDSVRKTHLNSTGPLFALAMLNKPFTFVLSPQGKIKSVEGVKEILVTELNKWAIKSDIQKQIFTNAESFGPMIEMLFSQNDIVRAPKGSVLESKRTDVPFILTNKNANTVTMQSSKVVDSIKVQSKYVIDLKSGLILSSLSTSESLIDDKPLPLATKKVVIKANTTQSTGPIQQRKAPDTSWINHAVKFSYWSNAYKKGEEYDSRKVYQLLSIKDAELLKDRSFVVSRLDAVQRVRGDQSYKVYDSLLVLTPTSFLQGNYSHLHNKLGSTLEKLGPDSAYEVSKYAINTDAMNEWTQQSFAQAFLGSPGDDRERIERLDKSYKLLNLLKLDKDDKFQQIITSLYLWANTLRNSDDLNGLTQAAKDLIAMNDVGIKKGNGGRYSLLIYQKLIVAKQNEVASKLLDTTIEKLGRYAADTLNTERFAQQNILAGAYFLKSMAAKASGDSSYLTYLAKAAKYSPSNSKEKAYSSFYDRVFLGTKESYKEEYMEQLFSSGNDQEALKMFVEQITAMPENLKKMQLLYSKRFPAKDFKTFFNKHVISTWAVAPSFLIKGINGKEHKLSDYKDQWLVMDFWGTWCGPCREEMPIVNKFGVEAAEGKHQNVSFLSVACRDTESKVKEYLAENKFSMTAAMSDGQIEQKYNIPYYPSKILISPQGKMIHIEFGKDWQAIIKSFTTL